MQNITQYYSDGLHYPAQKVPFVTEPDQQTFADWCKSHQYVTIIFTGPCSQLFFS